MWRIASVPARRAGGDVRIVCRITLSVIFVHLIDYNMTTWDRVRKTKMVLSEYVRRVGPGGPEIKGPDE